MFKSKILFSVLFAMLMTACSPENDQSETVVDENKLSTITKPKKELVDAKTLYADAAKILFKHRSVSASLFGIPETDAGYHYSDSLENYSVDSEHQFRAQMAALNVKLKLLKSTGKDNDNLPVMIDLTSYYAGDESNSFGFIDSWMGQSAFILNQINGPMIDVPNNLINAHVIKSKQDAVDYLRRLQKFGPMADSILDKAQHDEKAGWIPPKIIIEKTYSYLNGFTKIPAAESPLVTSFTKRIESLTDLSSVEKTKMTADAEKIVNRVVYPAFEKLASHTLNLEEKGGADSGIWAQPGGAEFYQYSISRLGDTDMSAEQIHNIGLEEVARISAQMERIFVAQGYDKGSIGERMIAINHEQRFLFEDSDNGRAELLADLNTMIDEISVIMPNYFKSIPSYRVEVKRIPIATQDTSAGGYYTPPTMDGLVPGIYWINLKSMQANPKYGLKTLTYHEAIPGHHWQIALNMEQKDLPLLRRIAPYNAYIEGWALYSEQLAAEMGLYKTDPFSDLGRLRAELFRAVRLVVDTGLHYKKWSREKAIKYMATTTGTEMSDVVSEIERYMVWPGQALGYKLGMLKIVKLRKLAEEKLGEHFNLAEFHDLVLLGGAVPMSVLQKKVEVWIEQQLTQSDNA
jgi:uncharacterized protein (DUF885 family)